MSGWIAVIGILMVGFGIFFNLRRTRQSTAAWSPADPWPAPTQPQIPLADARREVETIVAEGASR
jgi:hypothetical protein